MVTVKMISGCQKLEGRRDEEAEHGGFLGQKVQYDTIMVYTSLYICQSSQNVNAKGEL